MGSSDTQPIGGNPQAIFAISLVYTKDALRLYALSKQLRQPVGHTAVFFNYFRDHLSRLNHKVETIADRINDIGRVLETYAKDFRTLKNQSEDAAQRVRDAERRLDKVRDLIASIRASSPHRPLDPEFARRLKLATSDLSAAESDLSTIKRKWRNYANEVAATWVFKPFESNDLRDPRNEAALEKRIQAAMRAEKLARKVTQNTAVKIAGYLPYIGTGASFASITGLLAIKAALELRIRWGDPSALLELGEVHRQIIFQTATLALGIIGGKGVVEFTASKFKGELYESAVALLGANLANQHRAYLEGREDLKENPFFMPSHPSNWSAQGQVVNDSKAIIKSIERTAYGSALTEVNAPRTRDNGRTTVVGLCFGAGNRLKLDYGSTQWFR